MQCYYIFVRLLDQLICWTFFAIMDVDSLGKGKCLVDFKQETQYQIIIISI